MLKQISENYKGFQRNECDMATPTPRPLGFYFYIETKKGNRRGAFHLVSRENDCSGEWRPEIQSCDQNYCLTPVPLVTSLSLSLKFTKHSASLPPSATVATTRARLLPHSPSGAAIPWPPPLPSSTSPTPHLLNYTFPTNPNMLSTALGVGLGVFPLFATTPTSTSCAPPLPPSKLAFNDDDYDGDSANLEEGMGGLRACVDCGNKAKRDCSFRMCRTCCKGRGYDCATHVKSTWVPAARRRERQTVVAAFVPGGGSSGSSSAVAKRPRLASTQPATTSHTSTSVPNTPRSFDATSTHQDASFKESLPQRVRAPAVFRCIRVTAIEDGQNEYVYQAMVKINGHVFKGLLYDQGVKEKGSYPCISELHLETNTCGRNVDSSSSPLLHKADAYDASGCRGLLGGDQDCF